MRLNILVLYVLAVGAYASSPEENVNMTLPRSGATYMVEGDIIKEKSVSRAALRNKLWPYGELIYEITADLSGEPKAMQAIQEAMDDWSKYTCIKFVKRTKETAYVSMIKDPRGCYSYVGRIGRKQELSLDSGCWHKGIVIHEIGHALGFLHEQSRPDRDKYVTIKYENIEEGKESNFNINPKGDSLGTPYDYGSIMHYGEKYFSKNGRPTIVVKRNGATIGQRAGLSDIDIEQMNLLYKCNAGGVTTPSTLKPTPGAKDYKYIGCYKDKQGRKARAIPYITNFEPSIAIKECAKFARTKGYRVFAIRSKKRCYTGVNAHLNFKKYGKAKEDDCKKGLSLRNSVYSLDS